MGMWAALVFLICGGPLFCLELPGSLHESHHGWLRSAERGKGRIVLVCDEGQRCLRLLPFRNGLWQFCGG